MVTIQEILPSSNLSQFVMNYSLIKFETGLVELVKPWHALPETSLVFFLEDTPICLEDKKTCLYVDGSHHIWVQGLSTKFNGLMRFKGSFTIFVVQFMPAGFSKLFNIPLTEFINKLVAVADIFGSKIRLLLEQLQTSPDINHMARFANSFLTTFINIQNPEMSNNGIVAISQDIINYRCNLSIGYYAHKANMSLRNFERCFHNQVGTTPKLFCQLLRFNAVLNLKMRYPSKSWPSIATECGYFDQMHLIRDFKKISNLSPVEFFTSSPPPAVEYIKINP